PGAVRRPALRQGRSGRQLPALQHRGAGPPGPACLRRGVLMSELGLHEGEARGCLSFRWEPPPQPGQVREVAPGVLWLRRPLRLALDHGNVYLLRDGHGGVVVDAGLSTPPSREVWEAVFTDVFAGAPVLAVIATHFHYDRSGLLGWLVDRF